MLSTFGVPSAFLPINVSSSTFWCVFFIPLRVSTVAILPSSKIYSWSSPTNGKFSWIFSYTITAGLSSGMNDSKLNPVSICVAPNPAINVIKIRPPNIFFWWRSIFCAKIPIIKFNLKVFGANLLIFPFFRSTRYLIAACNVIAVMNV